MIGEMDGAELAGAQDRLGEPVPARPVVVGAVVGHKDLHAQHLRQRNDQSRTDRMDVEDLRMKPEAGVYDPDQGVRDGFEVLAPRMSQRHDPYAIKLRDV